MCLCTSSNIGVAGAIASSSSAKFQNARRLADGKRLGRCCLRCSAAMEGSSGVTGEVGTGSSTGVKGDVEKSRGCFLIGDEKKRFDCEEEGDII